MVCCCLMFIIITILDQSEVNTHLRYLDLPFLEATVSNLIRDASSGLRQNIPKPYDTTIKKISKRHFNTVTDYITGKKSPVLKKHLR